MADVYSWSRLTPLEAVKVVILGQVRYTIFDALHVTEDCLQDPYHNVGQAHGLPFTTSITRSFVNTFIRVIVFGFAPDKDSWVATEYL